MFVRTKLCAAMLLLLWASPCGPASIWGTLSRAKLRNAMLLLGMFSLGQFSSS